MFEKRILCLDIGLSRTGVAVSDALGYTAQGVEVIHKKDFYDVLRRVGELVEKYDVETIILGYPLRTDGKDGEKVKEIEEKKRLIEKKLKVHVELVDERYSTKVAELALEGMDHKKRTQVVDMLASQVILQGYLDYIQLQKQKQNKTNIEETSIKKGIRNMENEKITVMTADGQEIEYIIDDEFEFEGANYVVLCTEEDDEDALLFRLEEDEEGVMLYDLEDDEFDAVNDYYISLFEDEDDEE